MEKKNCTSCKWVTRSPIADQQGKVVVGQYGYSCRRFPPTALMIPSGPGQFNLGSAFPVVNDQMVCSLHQLPDSDDDSFN